MSYREILDYWFGDLKNDDYFPARKAKIWYRKDEKVDMYIRENFTEVWKDACDKKLGSWYDDPQGVVAVIIILDQFSRHLFRDDVQAYAQDEYCVDLCLQVLDCAPHLFTLEKAFLYMPLQHSEVFELQEMSVELYKKLADNANEKIREQMYGFYDYACAHRDVIKRFGRFPHRNSILQRESTEEERQFLQRRGSLF
ncbi:DUF924 family protein [Candidatus Uabimicrobium amorphum]|uniref:DUF924 domain-containing protein n=1 Tax=Uabimicrobium amorphum TaxID=2596890 RepID=A0A5S9ISC1_UABAM|nr:DUF924 family protein [Candidatus Uabimicrobium amorphum]BBM85785.1 hypothetical protein UABAM_04163 [Candidatus Uabimicrobium amorphum]